ncbi:MAG: hypothetical protein IPP14_07795 [Planctomycetes bacterium]|nr:hypothetical protein [Planctomycetota bacterium]
MRGDYEQLCWSIERAQCCEHFAPILLVGMNIVKGGKPVYELLCVQCVRVPALCVATLGLEGLDFAGAASDYE